METQVSMETHFCPSSPATATSSDLPGGLAVLDLPPLHPRRARGDPRGSPWGWVPHRGRGPHGGWRGLGCSCPGNGSRAFLAAVVAMGTGMLTKACEAEKTNCPHHYLRACQSNIFPYLPRRGESPGSTRRGREREESCLPPTPHREGESPAPGDGHHHLQPLHRGVPAL